MRETARGPILAAAVLAALLRAPFIFTGLSTDEGGYAYVAQQWSRGAKLYDTAWLDRPQGLLLTYRALLGIDSSGWTIRLGMVLAGAIITVALGLLGSQLIGRTAGIAAAWIYAVVGVAPHLEGMTFNGELLAGVPSTVAIALAVFWWRRSKSLWWLAGSGLLAGVALTMKQSGIDGIVVGLVIVAIATRAFRRAVTEVKVPEPVGAPEALTDTRVLGMRPPDPSTVGGPGGVGVRKAGAVFVGAVAVPLVASVLHGISVAGPSTGRR